MSIISAFAGRYSALDFAYGASASAGPALSIGVGNGTTGSSTITVISGATETTGGMPQNPITTSTPITVGIGANAETVTPTAVSSANLGSFGPGVNSVTVTASFSNLHGPQEPVTSGTYGLQEAINVAAAIGGGIVVVTAGWYNAGGTVAMIQAATLPNSGTVEIEDVSSGSSQRWGTNPNSVTVVSAPSAATSATVLTSRSSRHLDVRYGACAFHLRHAGWRGNSGEFGL